MIADDRGPVALAGIMGGAATAVSGETRDIFLESACFLPAGSWPGSAAIVTSCTPIPRTASSAASTRSCRWRRWSAPRR
ncbi:MAG: phenylalanine--tRNA ligase beta subunit-related protein [Halofilum sp. (in: g-proteobacteria)]|nr:phenylalanine--tRNA ligase beta subunit-related protein [Halofilum sp. (in: g-proteobacteria)]